MTTQSISHNPSTTTQENQLCFINVEIAKERFSQHQTVTSSPTPTAFSLQIQIQRQQKPQTGRNKAVFWSEFEELYYFDSVLRFVIENPYLTVSWAEWKPPQYYIFIAQKMAQIFGRASRNATQIKTKDQNLKKQHYHHGIKKHDIVEVAFKKVIFFVNKSKELLFKDQTVQRALSRCDATLRIYREQMREMLQPKAYEIQLAALIRFIQTSQGEACKVEAEESPIITFENKLMDAPIMGFLSGFF